MTNIEYENNLKTLVRNTEERYIWYKKQLEYIYKDEILKLDDYYKQFIRENKNSEEILLKSLRSELEYFRHGLNPPFCYPY